jgi:DNA-binding response OmpR family regulator
LGIERGLLDDNDLIAKARGERSRILLADDTADMRDYVGRLLSARHEVDAVPDGEATLVALRKSRFDLVLTDVMMPRLGGFGLLRAVREDPRLADIPVVLLSARAGEEASIEGVHAGADDYLVKPFSARELQARIEANLEKSRLRGQSRRAEESARLAEERLRAALLASSTGTFRWDIRAGAVEADEALNGLFGFSPAEARRAAEEFSPGCTRMICPGSSGAQSDVSRKALIARWTFVSADRMAS